MNDKKNSIGLVIVAVIAIIALFIAVGSRSTSPIPTSEQDFGGMSNVDGLTITPTESTDGLKVGPASSATLNTKIISGTCTLTSYAAISATSTQLHNCAITGVVTSGDRILVELPGGTALQGPGGFGSLVVAGATASSTAGNISVGILNLTGAATTSYPLASTSVPYFIFRNAAN
jgi:hypothetical protein